jgi:hypothetical protein
MGAMSEILSILGDAKASESTIAESFDAALASLSGGDAEMVAGFEALLAEMDAKRAEAAMKRDERVKALKAKYA